MGSHPSPTLELPKAGERRERATENAQFQIDTGNGPVTYYSTSNTVADAIQGVTLTLLKDGGPADTVTVGGDTASTVARMREFVTQFNSTLEFINTKTDFSATGPNATLAGDSGITPIASSLRQMLTGPIDGVATGKRTIADLGLSFGAVGSKVGTANTLTLDDTKFRAVLDADPAGVANVFSAFRATLTLDPGGTGGVASVSGDPTGVKRPGSYTFTTAVNPDQTANITVVFKPRDGGPLITTMLSNVTAGSTNASVIPGSLITFRGAFTDGTDTLTVATPTRGLAAKLDQYLDPLTRATGTLDQRQDVANKDVKDLKARVDRMNGRMNAERDRLQSKFATLETTLQRLQSQRAAVSALASLNI